MKCQNQHGELPMKYGTMPGKGSEAKMQWTGYSD